MSLLLCMCRARYRTKKVVRVAEGLHPRRSQLEQVKLFKEVDGEPVGALKDMLVDAAK